MKVLAVPLPPAAHIGSMVPMCWALRADGHQVLAMTSAQMSGAVTAAGLNVVETSEPDLPIERLRLGMTPDMFPSMAYYRRDSDAGAHMWRRVAHTWFDHARLHIDEYLRVASHWQPDLILTDPLHIGGRLLGDLLDVPVAVHRWGVDPTAGPFDREARRLAARLAQAYGRGTAASVLDPVLVVDACPPSLQIADAGPASQVGFVPYNGTGVLPDWMLTPSRGRRVCVCLGGTVMSLAGPAVLHAAIEALGDIDDVEVIVALSPADRRRAGDLPGRVRVVESLPLNLFLPGCDLLVHHGGSTTGLTASWFGLPQLVLPQFFDQFDYGHLLARAGAGIVVDDAAGQSDVDRLRAACRLLLTLPRFAAHARRVRAEMTSAPGYSTVVTLLAELVSTNRTAALRPA